jgi:spore maturation protein CgeB
MKILCVLGEYNYGDESRGNGYEYVNFLPALRRLGHEVIFFESFNKKTYKDFAELNRYFLETVQKENPDVILTVLLGYELWSETLNLVRLGSKAILINWSTDDSWKYEQFSRFIAKPFHIYATTYPDAVIKSELDGHSNFVLTQWAANSESLSVPVPAKDCRHQVSFVGSAYGNRPKWVAALKERGINVECFGHGWGKGSVTTEEMQRIIRESVIALNFGDSGWVLKGLIPTRSRQIKARIFEVPGAGGFLFTEKAENLESFYIQNKEIIVFDGIDDLALKIRYYIEHPDERDQIAIAGNNRTRLEHTYDARFKIILGMALSLISDTPNSCNIDFNQFAEIEKMYKPTIILKLTRSLLLAPCVLLWGKKRGPRSARRILFELSWRIVGKKTYSVTGWPGRLFYKES